PWDARRRPSVVDAQRVRAGRDVHAGVDAGKYGVVELHPSGPGRLDHEAPIAVRGSDEPASPAHTERQLITRRLDLWSEVEAARVVEEMNREVIAAKV